MDPISATIGLVSGISTIVGVIGGSVSTLNNIRVYASDAELNIELLVGQLQTVQAALRQVQAFLASLSTPFGASDEQLIFDLGDSLSHCRLLVQYIDNQISKFAWAPGSRITGQRLLTLILEDKSTKDCLTRLDHQVSALNLCLTAFRCRTISQTTRTPDLEEVNAAPAESDEKLSTFSTVKSSLSRSTATNLSIIKCPKSPASSRTTSPTDCKPSEFLSPLGIRDKLATSARLDSLIKKDAVERNQRLRILALGHNRSTVVKQLRINLGEKLDENELENHRKSIVSLVTFALLSVVKYVEDTMGGLVSEQSCRHLEVLRQFARCANWLVNEEVALAATSVWGNWFVKQSFHAMDQTCNSAYFLQSTVRIMHPAYVPSSVDIIRAPERIQTVKSTKLNLRGISVDVIEPPRSGLPKILHQFEETHGCLAYIDISSYDQHLDEDHMCTVLSRTLSYFRAVFRTGLFASKAVLLCVANTKAFRERLPTSPLTTCFPDYTGGSDPNLALQFVVKKCQEVVIADLLYTHCATSSEDPTTIQFFRSKAEGLKTTLDVTKYMGFCTLVCTVPVANRRHRKQLA